MTVDIASDLVLLPSPLPADLLRRYRYGVLSSRAEMGATTLPLIAEGFSNNAADMPALLDLAALPESERDQLWQQMDEAGNAGEPTLIELLIDTTFEPHAMQSHWCRVQSARHASDVGWLRAFDPRVLLHLPRVLGPQGWRWLTRGCHGMALQLAGQWWALQLPGISNTAASVTWSTDVWLDLQRIGPVNRALHLLSQHDAAGLLALAPRLNDLVTRAQRRHGTSRSDELAAYAVLGHEIHPRFDEHPLALAQLQAHADPEFPVASPVEALQRLTANQRARIRDDMAIPFDAGPASQLDH